MHTKPRVHEPRQIFAFLAAAESLGLQMACAKRLEPPAENYPVQTLLSFPLFMATLVTVPSLFSTFDFMQ
jgi:transcriptional regulator of nitric oxide reductase